MKALERNIKSILGAIAFVVVALSCSNDFEEITDFSDDLPEQESTNTVITYTANGLIYSKIAAKSIKQFAGDTIVGPKTVLDKGFVTTFYDSLQNLSSQISANEGVWYKDKKMMEAYGNVIAYSVDGDTLFTEELMWDQDSAIIFTDAPVKIKKPNATIYGTGLVADQEFKEYRIKKITGEVDIPKEDL